MREPLPLHQDASVDEGLRRDLANVRAMPAPPFDFERGLKSIRASIERQDGVITRPHRLTRSGVWRLVAGVTVLCVGAAIVARGSSRGEPVPTDAPATSPTIAVADEPRLPVRDEARQEEAPVMSPGALPDAPRPAVSTAVRSAPVQPATAHASSPAPAASTSPRIHEELVHMRTLRQLAATDPTAALAMADEGQRRFAAGVFTQEREVIAIEALQRLGQADTARRRATRFLEDHPESPFADKVRLLSR